MSMKEFFSLISCLKNNGLFSILSVVCSFVKHRTMSIDTLKKLYTVEMGFNVVVLNFFSPSRPILGVIKKTSGPHRHK